MAREVLRQRHEGSAYKSSAARIAKTKVPIREEESKIPVDDLQDIQNPARVRVSGGITKKTGGEFEFIRVDVSVEMPCAPNEKAVKKTYKDTAALVEKMIEKEVAYAEGRLDD